MLVASTRDLAFARNDMTILVQHEPPHDGSFPIPTLANLLCSVYAQKRWSHQMAPLLAPRKEKEMKTLTVPLALVGAVVAGALQIGVSSAVADAAGLRVAWKEAGLTAGTTINYTVSADAKATYGCFNRGGHNPNSANKRVTFTTKIANQVKLVIDSQGAAAQTRLAIPAVGARLSCPNGQSAMVSSVSYSNVTIANNTLATSARLPGVFSKTIRPLN